MKVVFDTNVIVSAFIVPGSKEEEALLLAHRRKVDLSVHLSSYFDRDHTHPPNQIRPA